MRHGACYTKSLNKTAMNLFNLPDPEDTEEVFTEETPETYNELEEDGDDELDVEDEVVEGDDDISADLDDEDDAIADPDDIEDDEV
jgi:hypothetical protein